jgi:cell wall-associated NlpC family hydrolase
MPTAAAFFPGRVGAGFRDRLIAYAHTLVGVPYEINLPGEAGVPGGRGWGKKYPELDKGLDCSGFVLNVLQHMGVLTDLDPDLTSCDTLWSHCQPIEPADTRPGDLVFFAGTYDTPGLSHIGIVTQAGAKAMINARAPHVRTETLGTAHWNAHLAGFGRVPGVD